MLTPVAFNEIGLSLFLHACSAADWIYSKLEAKSGISTSAFRQARSVSTRLTPTCVYNVGHIVESDEATGF